MAWLSRTSIALLLVFALPLWLVAWIPRSSIPLFCSKGEYRGKIVLVTGASSGIGRKLAIELADKGASLILVARRQNELEETARLCRDTTKIALVHGDLASTAVVDQVVRAVHENFAGHLDLAIMNHAVVPGFLFQENLNGYVLELRKTMDINFFSVVQLTHALIPLLENSSGKVVGIGTGGQYFPVTFLSAYAISKVALEAYFDHLRLELSLSQSKIKVSYLVLGQVETEQLVGLSHGQDLLKPLYLGVDEAVREMLCVIDRDVERTYVPYMQMSSIIAFRELLRPLWTYANWKTWIEPNSDFHKRFLHVVNGVAPF